jgi:uncharacterized protein (TIGR03000 family)
VVVAHLPEDAQLFFEDRPTYTRGTLRQYISPPLAVGEEYSYTVRVIWAEDSEWVTQMVNVPVRAGGVHCGDLIAASKDLEKGIAAALGKLPPEDWKVAEQHRFCAVQEGIRLGSMGPPVKVWVKGQPVFLCCPACQAAAMKNADETLKKADALRVAHEVSAASIPKCIPIAAAS